MSNIGRGTLVATFGVVLLAAATTGQRRTVSADTEWTQQRVVVLDTPEAAVVIRVGDVDNLGFGWQPGFDPFCGRSTDAHRFPFVSAADDLPGFDRILLSARYDPLARRTCNGDGYSVHYGPKTSKPVAFDIPTDALAGITIADAALQVFIDDFQAPSMCSKFQVIINGTRCAECERLFNAVDQTGPVGKLLTIPLPGEFLAGLAAGRALSLRIEEVTGAADGFAVDFVRLLVNRRPIKACQGTVRGIVIDKTNRALVGGARVSTADGTSVVTGADGRFLLKNVPAGYEVLTASAVGFADGTGVADIGPGDANPDVTIPLARGRQVLFDDKPIATGEAVNLPNIFFDQGKADLRPQSRPELDKVVAFLKTNGGAEIELSGHTSAEGDAAFNRALSYRRVKACKDYIVSRGLDPGRIIARGYGADRPVAPNDTEENRSRNRRVDMRVVKL